MKALTVCFDFDGKDSYKTLLQTFRNSWDHNASIPLEVHEIDPPDVKDRHKSFYANTKKLKIWQENFDQDTIFLDADMLCMRCPAEGFDLVDDIGITDREGDQLPINGGVMFMKYTKRARQFMQDMVDVNNRMLEDEEFHKPWLKKYAGINQSAIGYLIENEYQDFNLLPGIYNCCDPWSYWKNAYMIHVKGSLRKACLSGRRKRRRGGSKIMDIREVWDLFAPEDFERIKKSRRRVRRKRRVPRGRKHRRNRGRSE